MQLKVNPGKYILAVSGGVDSMTLLNMLSNLPNLELIVAHLNHGIRSDSAADERLVKKTASSYGLRYESGLAKLGPKASEDKARQARYEFLNNLKDKYMADAIITAHHQDDMIETAFLNILRGSGRKGVSAISQSDTYRPLLAFKKNDVLAYARKHKIIWREDSTNQQSDYLRNYLRNKTLTSMSEVKRQEIINNIEKIAKINLKTDQLIATLSHNILKDDSIDRSTFIQMPANISKELVAYWLRDQGFRQFNRKMVQGVSTYLKTGSASTRMEINKHLELLLTQKTAHFTTTD